MVGSRPILIKGVARVVIVVIVMSRDLCSRGGVQDRGDMRFRELW